MGLCKRTASSWQQQFACTKSLLTRTDAAALLRKTGQTNYILHQRDLHAVRFAWLSKCSKIRLSDMGQIHPPSRCEKNSRFLFFSSVFFPFISQRSTQEEREKAKIRSLLVLVLVSWEWRTYFAVWSSESPQETHHGLEVAARKLLMLNLCDRWHCWALWELSINNRPCCFFIISFNNFPNYFSPQNFFLYNFFL